MLILLVVSLQCIEHHEMETPHHPCRQLGCFRLLEQRFEMVGEQLYVVVVGE